MQSASGQSLIEQAKAAMTDEQKAQIIAAALQGLDEGHKAQIRDGAVQSLTDEQKTQIKNAYIEETMLSKEVTDQITAAVAVADAAAASVTALKGQLDNYSLFYEGLKNYTSAVSNAASGANTLKLNMDTLYANVGTLKISVGKLNDGVKSLLDGITELNKGVGEFTGETDHIQKDVRDEMDSIINSALGSSGEITSFVSEKNTNVDSVQFVIQTEAVKLAEIVDNQPIIAEKLSFWQKLLRLFGLH